MKRGRPNKSIVRERMQQIVDAIGVTYGYEIFKVYAAAFSPIDIRSMYYHLRKGVALDEFALVGVKEEKGAFTWGDISIRRYYVLGPEAKERATEELRQVSKSLGLKMREPKDAVDWNEVLKERAGVLKKEYAELMKAKAPSAEQLQKLSMKASRLFDWFSEKKVKTKELEDLLNSLKNILGK